MSIWELQKQVDALAQAPPQHRMETYSCEYCGGIPHPVFDCQTGNTPNYDQVPVTIKTLVLTNLHSILRVSHNSSTVVSSMEVHIIVMICKQGKCPLDRWSLLQSELYSDCQTRNQLVHEPNPGNNYDFPCFEQPPQYHIDQSPPKDLVFDSLMHSYRENNHILEEILRTQEANSPVVLKEHEGSDDYTEVTYDKERCLSDHYTAPVTSPTYTPSIPFLATMEPSNTFLIGDKVMSTTPERENDKFIKSSVDDFVPTPRESEVTSVYDDLECDMPINTLLATTDVREENFDINSPLVEYVVDFLMENEDVAGLPRQIKYLFNHLIKNPSLTKGMSDEPLGDDSKPSSYDATFSNPLFDFNDDSTLCYDNPLFDEEFEDISSLDPPESTPVIDESSLLVTPLPDLEQICLREVERFDPFFSLTQSGEATRVMKTPSFSFHQEIPSGESKVHIEVLSVLRGNRLPGLVGQDTQCLGRPLLLSLKGWSFQKKAHSKNNKSETDKSLLDHGRLAYRCGSFQKGRGSPGRNKTPGPWSARIPMWQLFKGPRDNIVA
ncbi:hypothetical protein Tco_0332491 [Tanacetum coccineum]